MKRKIEMSGYGKMIKLQDGGSCTLIDAESDQARKMMERAVEEITNCPQFRGAEIARERFERAKNIKDIQAAQYYAYHAHIMYVWCYRKLAMAYLDSLIIEDHNREDDEAERRETKYIDITPFGVLQDEIRYAMKLLQRYY